MNWLGVFKVSGSWPHIEDVPVCGHDAKEGCRRGSWEVKSSMLVIFKCLKEEGTPGHLTS